MAATSTLGELAARTRAAQTELRGLGRGQKDAALHAIADELLARRAEILAANADDVAAGHAAGLGAALIDRLTLDDARLDALAAAARAVAALPDPCGAVIEGFRLPNGLNVVKERVPIGRILVVYEARPNVTIDVACLSLKSGNVALLRGSSSAKSTNAALAEALRSGLERAGVTRDAAITVDASRDELAQLVASDAIADLVIPRGGEALKHFLLEHSRIPVLAAAGGNCHVYVDAAADATMAEAIIVNAKTQRPGVCNAAETLLVHADRIDALPQLLAGLAERDVELRGCPRTQAAAPADVTVLPADEDDWATEYLDLILAVRIVDSLEQATEHIARYSTGHSEAIVTDSLAAADAFIRAVDSACVYVNASTRFTDGGEYGKGAEIANSTARLHARGPVSLEDLTTSKFVVRGSGHIRA